MTVDAFQFVSLAIGAVLGVASSGVFWWIQAHYFVPKLEFSEEISKKKNSFTKQGWMYRVKLRNVSRRRAIDVRFVARLAVVGLHYENTTWINIPVTPFSTPAIGKLTGDRIVRFRAEQISHKMLGAFPDNIKAIQRQGCLTIEHLLSVKSNSYLVLYVFSHDEFSGSKKLHQSKKYTIRDVRKGMFKEKDLNIVSDDLEVSGWTEIDQLEVQNLNYPRKEIRRRVPTLTPEQWSFIRHRLQEGWTLKKIRADAEFISIGASGVDAPSLSTLSKYKIMIQTGMAYPDRWMKVLVDLKSDENPESKEKEVLHM